MDFSNTRVLSLVYMVSVDTLSVVLLRPDAQSEFQEIASLGALLEQIEKLHLELNDRPKLERGRTPRLKEFASDWGRKLLPNSVLDDPPDVLVIVPHAIIHDLPLHLVSLSDGRTFGSCCGVTYVSSMSLFRLCAQKNPVRRSGATQNVVRERTVQSIVADVYRGEDRMFRQLVNEVTAGLNTVATPVFEPDRGTRVQMKYMLHRRPAPNVLIVLAHGFIDTENHRLSGLLFDREKLGPSWVGGRARMETIGGTTILFREEPIRDPPSDTTRPADLLTTTELEIFEAFDGELVLLLACSSGRGRVGEGDEPSSLAEAFLHIGAPSVVAPMWDAEFDSTCLWARTFCEEWRNGITPKAVAAQRAMAKVESEFQGAPAWFGCLSLRGDWL